MIQNAGTNCHVGIHLNGHRIQRIPSDELQFAGGRLDIKSPLVGHGPLVHDAFHIVRATETVGVNPRRERHGARRQVISSIHVSAGAI